LDPTLAYILACVTITSAISLIGVFTLTLKKGTFDKAVFGLVSFATGTLLGGAFFHLLPEALEFAGEIRVFGYVVLGIVSFFMLERCFYWRHCHDDACGVHSLVYLNLLGDGAHNFIDGMIIAASFLFGGTSLGVITTVAIVFHEIPQEIGDFGILVYGGLGKTKALWYNLLSALTAVLGALLVYTSSITFGTLSTLLVPFAAGGFIYIANSDLVPELHKERNVGKSVAQFMLLLTGLLLMWVLGIFLK
jgi:zinc and cadmium transporter